jgi:Nucleotide modification associated domain 2
MKKKRDPVLFSYVVDHDLGFAPNPYDGYCTLVHCKFKGKSSHRNIVEIAEKGDWIIGTGGKGKDSAGHGQIIYLMRIDRKNPKFHDYLANKGFQKRSDCIDYGSGNESALVARDFFYFGRNALAISDSSTDLAKNIEKKGRGFRRDYPPQKLKELVKWFRRNYENSMHGNPCGAKNNTIKMRRRIACRQYT